ncbi:MAG TPA: GGDEF domain-containing protein [Candidatus Limnocylindrales bacterium]
MSFLRRIRPEYDSANPLARRVWRLRWLLAAFSTLLGVLVLVRLSTLERPIDIVILILLPLVAATELMSWYAVEAREGRRRVAAEDMARILRDFSRVESPDGIVEAILAEVARGTGADHLVVVQRRPGTPILDATLIATRPGGQSSSAFLPAADLEPDPPIGPLPERRGRHRNESDAGALIPVGVGVATAGRDSVAAHAMTDGSAGTGTGAADANRAEAGEVDAGGFDIRCAEMRGADERGTAVRPVDARDDVTVGVAVGPGRGPALAADETPEDVRAARASLRGQPDPAAAAAAVAARVETRVRRTFGISRTLAVPLVAREEILGVIVISRRRPGGWPEGARRILDIAAAEAATALARVHSLRDAQTRASTDPLTGLPNRRYFEEYVELLGRGRRAEDALGILMVDVDRFKVLNDRHGHAIGDVVLRAIGRTIATTVRDLDVPARFGGEEFVILLRNPSQEVALEVGERIRDAVARIDLHDIGVGAVTVSVGASVSRSDDEAVATLVERADHALYRAKRQGRNRVEAA